MPDILLESVLALILFGLVLYLTVVSRTRTSTASRGWNWIVGGFCLLLFSNLIGIADNFETLNQYAVIGDPEIQVFLEKVVGSLGGYLAFTIGFFLWVPEAFSARKQAEQKATQNAGLLRDVERISNTGHWTWVENEEDARVVSCSEQAARIFGTTVKEFIASSSSREAWLQWVFPDDRDAVNDAVQSFYLDFQENQASASPFDIEYRIVRTDGKVRHIREQAASTTDDHGIVSRSVGTIQDITEHKRLNEKVRTRDAWLSAILENAPIEIVLKDTEGRIMAISRSVSDDLGCGREGFLGLTTADFLPDDIAAIYMTADREVVESGKLIQQEVAEEIDGVMRHSLNAKFPLRDEDGKINGVCSLTTNITEIKQAEVTLREAHGELEQRIRDRTSELEQEIQQRIEAEGELRISEARFRDFAVGASDWFWEMDENLCFSYFSERFTEISGVVAEDLLGKTRRQSSLDMEDKRVRQNIADLEAHRPFRDFEHSRTLPDGSAVYMATSGTPIFDINNVFKGYRGTGSDVTAWVEADHSLRLAKEAAEVANQAKSEFLSTINHELRTPLTSIKGSIGILRGFLSEGLSEKGLELLEIASRNSDELIHIVNDMLDYEKAVSGSLSYQMSPFDIGALTQSAVDLTQEYAKSRGANFSCHTDQSNIWASIDEHRYGQILRNLLSNAAKFSHQGGTVDISLLEMDGYVRIEVTDYGVGIPLEYQATIFDPFVQIDSSDARQHSGTGLGLSICKTLVEDMDGSVGFTSEPGVGSTFFVEFPTVAPPDTA
ncbi:MAG: PAS domain S-box protein [Rhodospirillales bacterium]|jgi:PAS domain S-box-containing protein|nr:PAS domain S-box protein [Rhodospirillales bacterium]MBT4040356.1 PAS domain S-box protein [Rhodospirillales bacterium]MBT4625336.1 PAS domain S-box protein [Rhodospirillales bacterium]MBT5353212.1 PAS domain S-box protein [Rhodospirillales bacterium]MBT5519366.1 PAS domain S-box protein [Rhodospirillales bacterium]